MKEKIKNTIDADNNRRIEIQNNISEICSNTFNCISGEYDPLFMVLRNPET